MPMRVKKLPLTATRKVQIRNKRNCRRGKLRLQRVQAVAENQRKGHNEQPDDFTRTKRVFAENLEHIGKQRDAGAEKDEAYEIERRGLFLAIVGQMEIDHQQPCYADGNVYEENVSPIEIAKD